jgi:hypothetical protein
MQFVSCYLYIKTRCVYSSHCMLIFNLQNESHQSHPKEAGKPSEAYGSVCKVFLGANLCFIGKTLLAVSDAIVSCISAF